VKVELPPLPPLPPLAKKALNALPDLRDEPVEVQAFAAIVGSIAVHILLLLIWLSLQNGWIEKLLGAIPKLEAPLELILAPMAPPEKLVVPLDQLREKERVDSAALSEAQQPRKEAVFQSDRNLAAGSVAKPSGNALQPSADGRNTAAKTLVTQDAKAGSSSTSKSKTANTPPPMSKTTSTKVASLSKKPAARPEVGTQTERFEDLEELAGELVFRKFAAGSDASNKSADSKAASSKESAEKSVDDLFQEGKEQSKVKGGLAQNGKTGVDASKTALAAYMKSVSRAIGARWNVLVKEKMDLLDTGSVKVRFKIASDGTVRDVVVEHSTANRQFSEICMGVVRAATLDPPPEEARPLLRDGLLEIPFTFSLY
jgi:TonB family protein